ncbi:carbon-nitrogen hydrolase family protein [Paenibacillus oceani]|uniref:Carbon-nitrogen hydrolase family protein n=1 Tax=Paenibacillus oceani TaxID=2772510 RepID=A0A927CD58_9BACL|nr:carbon-nitrogen hydrolase family protein [Paenibacillus oceani]MBD2865284.1 carbon-nitrogen hydrolase family protein [Paenibacillus oceani]
MLPTNRIAAVQYGLSRLRSGEAFWANVRRYITKAGDEQAKLIVFPEYLTGHLLSLAPAMTNAEACEYLHARTDEYMTRFTDLSREYGMMILAGTHIHREGSSAAPGPESKAYYNEAFLFFPDGRIERHKKNHLTPEEQRAWPLLPGDQYEVHDTEIGKIAIQICYDIEFPEGSRIVADRGADIILCPSYTDAAAGYWRVRNCSQARAIENQLYVALSGLAGSMAGVEQVDVGFSRAGVFAPCDRPFPPDGILAVGSGNRGGLVYGDADLGLLTENRTQGGVAPFRDRRPELYAAYARRT